MENLKLSYYTIHVKLESEQDKYLLVHGYTGAIDIVEGYIWKAISDLSHTNTLSPSLIQKLSKRGYLTTKSVEEEQAYVFNLARMFHEAQGKLYKTFGFIISYNCNFRCPYCFENEISCSGRSWSKSTFTKAMVDKAYEAMMKIEPRKALHYKNILLYGGEPFLRENRDIVEYIVMTGVELGYKFKAISNGYDINYFDSILYPKYIYSCQITLDGSEEHHNSRRYHYKEGDSFNKIISNIELLLQRGISVRLRVNTDESNFNDFDVLKDLIKEKGFDKYPYFDMYSSVLRKYEVNENKDISYLSMKSFNKKHNEKYNGSINCQDFGIYKHFYSYLKNNSRCRLYSASCSSQYGSFLFDPQGNIYTCLEVVGKKEHIIGHYDGSDGVQWTEVREHWFNRNVMSSVMCRTCKYALLCGGGCLAKVIHTKDGFSSSFCNKFKTLFPFSINKAYNAYKKDIL